MKKWILKKLEGGRAAFEARRKAYEGEEGDLEENEP